MERKTGFTGKQTFIDKQITERYKNIVKPSRQRIPGLSFTYSKGAQTSLLIN